MFYSLISALEDFTNSGDEYDYEFLKNSLLMLNDDQLKLVSELINSMLDQQLIDPIYKMRFIQIRDLANTCLIGQN
jgi:hypothetical protein